MIEGIFLILALIIPTISHAYLSNHSFVFVTGWPQSGTSFMHQLLSQNQQSISSMIKLCEKILGPRKCQSWNHEGQWMIDGKLREVIDSGNICPVESKLEEDKKQAILTQLSRFWLMDKPYLIEKSPQNFVKIPMLRDLFAGAKSIKIIVVLKHPVTLNIATLRETSWRYRKIADDLTLLPGQVRQGSVPEYRELTNLEIHNNFRHFIELMTHRVNTSQVQDCSLGWLPAMNHLYNFLNNNRDFASKQVRIVRFERLVRPVSVCMDLFQFIFDDDEFPQHKSHVTTVCQKYLSNTMSATTGDRQPGNEGLKRGIQQPVKQTRPKRSNTQLTISKAPKPGPTQGRIHRSLSSSSSSLSQSSIFATNDTLIKETDEETRRQLRLRTTRDSSSFTFRPELVKENGVRRVQEFVSVFQLYYLAKHVHEQIVQINERLLDYGYQLTSFYPYHKNLFAPWELKHRKETP